jgi:hypothetical protein
MKTPSVLDSLARVCVRHRIRIDTSVSARELPEPREDVLSAALTAVQQVQDALDRAFRPQPTVEQR